MSTERKNHNKRLYKLLSFYSAFIFPKGCVNQNRCSFINKSYFVITFHFIGLLQTMSFLYQQIIFFLYIIYHAQTFPSSLTLGFLGPTNLPNSNTQAGGHPALFAFKLAIRDINNRSDLLPRTNLNFVNNNTNSDVGIGIIEAFWQCVYGNVIGIVGEYVSVVSQVKT
jgi:hypothetical protein